MARQLDEVLEAALELTPEARVALAGYLLESVEPEPSEEVEAAWRAEIARRIAEIEQGSVQLVPWSEARRQILEA